MALQVASSPQLLGSAYRAASAYEAVTTTATTNTVVISREEYRTLRSAYHEYTALRNALLAGGVTTESLEVLIKTGLGSRHANDVRGHEDESVVYPGYVESNGNAPELFELPTRSRVRLTHPLEQTNGSSRNGGKSSDGQNNGKNAPLYSSPSADKSGSGTFSQVQDSNKSRRTLFFSNLPKDATYSDLVAVVRGGALVDVWMKDSDRCASVSFIDSADADAYLRYAKKNEIFIGGWRVDVKWREASRQFVILRNVRRQIENDGASRILYLHNAPSTLTEGRLREDLEHIANLRVEKITRHNAGKDIQCNLNSVCAALFARTCLKSRAYYKVCKIDFGVDECAKPLPDFKEYRKTVSVERPSSNHTNRFGALFNDDETEGDKSESDGDSSTASATTYYEGETKNWADNTAAEGVSGGGTELYY